MILKCEKYVKHKNAKLTTKHYFPGLGLYGEDYDTNEDGIPDVKALSTVPIVYIGDDDQGDRQYSFTHHHYAIRYMVDTNYDGKSDILAGDVLMTGACSGLVTLIDASTEEGRAEMETFRTMMQNQQYVIDEVPPLPSDEKEAKVSSESSLGDCIFPDEKCRR